MVDDRERDSDSAYDDVCDAAYNVLLPHARYMEGLPEGSTHVDSHEAGKLYYPDMNFLVELARTISLGFLTSVLASLVFDKMFKCKQTALSPQEIEEARKVIAQARSASGSNAILSAEQISRRQAALEFGTEILRIHGWPKQMAREDAEKILNEVERSLKRTI